MRTIAVFLIVALAGCAAQAAAPGPNVDMKTLVRQHPLYGTLAQYDRQIAELRATLHVPEFSQKQAALAHARQGTDKQLEATAARSREIAALPTPDVRALSADQNASAPSESDVQGDVQQAYDVQAAQLRALAQQDMTRYRASLLAQQNRAFQSYVRSVNARVQQAYRSHEQELYEKESTLALNLAKADMTKRLTLRAKLQTLTLRDQPRHALRAQLDAIQNREDTAVERLHKQDQARLAAFLSPLQARAGADIARMRADLQARTTANLAERRRVLDAQTARQTQLNFGSPVQTAAGQTGMRTQLDRLLHARPSDPNAFVNARAELDKQFAQVAGRDEAATHSTWAQIAQLETARAQLYSDIVSQIQRDVNRVEREHPGANVTQAVQADFAALAH